MDYKTWSHRNGLDLFNKSDKYIALWREVESVLVSITDRAILTDFQSSAASTAPTSLSHSINRLLLERFSDMAWEHNANIFTESDYLGKSWTLDYSKGPLSVEIAFDHGSVIAWNLVKPSLASEPNDVKQDLSTSASVIVTVTQEMKTLGGFDSAIGTFEKYVHYLRPMQQLLPTPLVIVGLEAPKAFHIEHSKYGNRKVGKVVMNS
jgi:hypothetical protein